MDDTSVGQKDRPDSQAQSLLGSLLQTDGHFALDMLAFAQEELSFASYRQAIEALFLPTDKPDATSGAEPELLVAEDSNDLYTAIERRRPIVYVHHSQLASGATVSHEQVAAQYAILFQPLVDLAQALQGRHQQQQLLHQDPGSNTSSGSSLPMSVQSTLTYELPSGRHTVIALPAFNTQEANSALVLYFQVPLRLVLYRFDVYE
jgi:hypothetical protein